MDGATEHHLVDLGGHHHEALHEHAQNAADKRAYRRKQQRLAIDVRVHLARVEASFSGGTV